jgi:hypothetical protein
LHAYADYARALKNEVRLCLRMASALDLGSRSEPLDVAAGMPLLAAAEDVRSELFEALLLLGDADTVTAARAWQQSVWSLQFCLEPNFRGGETGFLEAFRQAGVARDRFYDVARAHLQVPGAMPGSAPVEWLPREERPI